MDPRLQLRVQRYGWDAAADIYEDAWDRHLAASRASLVRALDPQRGEKVVDVAAGTGLLSFELAEIVGPSGQVLATDLSAEMVRIGGAEAESRRMPNVTFERCNAEDLPYDDGIMDRAACAFGLMYVPDPVKALTEMGRILRPDGKIAVAIWGERRKCGWADIFPIVDARVSSEVCPMFFGQGTPGALVSDMSRAGFADIREERIQATLDFSSAAEAIHAVIDGGAVAMAAKRFGPGVRAEVEAEFLSAIAPFRQADGYAVPAEFVVASGVAQGDA